MYPSLLRRKVNNVVVAKCRPVNVVAAWRHYIKYNVRFDTQMEEQYVTICLISSEEFIT